MAGQSVSWFKAVAIGVCALAMGGGMLSTTGSSLFDRMALRETLWSRPTKAPRPPKGSTPGSTNPIYPEETFVASNFDVNAELVPSWGSGAIAPSNGSDPAGSFRFTCNVSRLTGDDPVNFPGQPGKSHLNELFGNSAASATSTYSSLRLSGSSTCHSPVDRSSYSMSAMYDGVGHVVRPDYISFHYQRRPASDRKCDPTKDSQAVGICIPLPNGLRFAFGFDAVNPSATTAFYFTCDGPTATPGQYRTISEAAAKCPSREAGNRLGIVIKAPDCWNGKDLDSPDHRSHVAYSSAGWLSGTARCPSTHPFHIPGYSMSAWYTVDANLNSWRLSSDASQPDLPAGSTFQANWFGAWDNGVMSMWVGNCINKRLNCSGGDLGNGKQMKQFSGFSWTANPRLVPMPNAPAPAPTPTPAPANRTMVSEGDSISVFWPGSHTGVYAKARPEITFHGLAVGGSGIEQMKARASGVTDKNPQVVTILIGANGISFYGSPQGFLDNLYAYTDPLRARGIKVAVGTILPQYRPTSPSTEVIFNSYRATINAGLRTSTRIDAVIDFAADPEMGPDAAARNTALYRDGVHPTTACGPGCGGQGKMAVIYQTVVDRLFGL